MEVTMVCRGGDNEWYIGTYIVVMDCTLVYIL